MNLEFELEIYKESRNMIQYNVLRKGLCVGILIMEKPYNHPTARKEIMEMK